MDKTSLLARLGTANKLAMFLLASLAFFSNAVLAEQVFSRNGLAISGYDTVAYFTEGRPVRGNSAHTYQWQGTNWQFSSKENRELFAANPKKYAPQYDGYCAYAAAQGAKAPTDPNAWTVFNGKLYLNYSTGVQSRWLKDRPGYISSADRKWQ